MPVFLTRLTMHSKVRYVPWQPSIGAIFLFGSLRCKEQPPAFLSIFFSIFFVLFTSIYPNPNSCMHA